MSISIEAAWNTWKGVTMRPPTVAEMLEGALQNIRDADREAADVERAIERAAVGDKRLEYLLDRRTAIPHEIRHWKSYAEHWRRELHKGQGARVVPMRLYQEQGGTP